MPAGLIVPISGPYLATFGGFPAGTQDDDGFELAATPMGQEVGESDAYGLTLVEIIYRGMNWRFNFRGIEWNKTGLLTALQMYGTTASVTPPIPAATNLIPALANIGNRATLFAQTLLLTAILGNPPTIPQSLTALNCVLAAGQESAFDLTSKLRKFPLAMKLLPYSASVGSLTFNIPFTTT